MNKVKKKQKKSLRIPLILLSIVVFVGVLLVFNSRSKNIQNEEIQLLNSSDTVQPINLDPPSEEEKAETRDHKDRLETKTPSVSENNEKQKVQPIIVSAGKFDDTFEVSSYVDGVIEDKGVCTVIFSMGSVEVKKTTKSEKDVSKTLCPTVTLPESELSKGTWNVKVSYESDKAEGVSESKSLEIL